MKRAVSLDSTRKYMFEQSLYDIDPIAPPTAEGDLFHDYELRNWDLGPRVYKIAALAAIANLLAIIILAETPLLTMKGCDSPLVSTVCQALDTVVVGAAIFGSEREYIDAAYEKTSLGDVEVTFVDVSGQEPQFQYPGDYFQLANPEDFQASVETQTGDPFSLDDPFPTNVPITRPSTGNSLINTTPKTPKHNNNLIDGELPGAIGSTTKPDKGKPGPTPTPDTTAETPKVDRTDPVTAVDLNKRPFIDLGNMINGLLDAKQVNLETPFLVAATFKLGKDGRMVPGSYKVQRRESADPKMLEVVDEAVKALDASGYLRYLSDQNVKNLSFVIQQDGSNVTGTLESQLDNDLRPKTLSTYFNGLISYKKIEKEAPGASQNDKDDLVLLQNATSTYAGKKFTISFTLPEADLQRMVQRKLAEQKAEPKMQQQNNNVPGRHLLDNTAKK